MRRYLDDWLVQSSSWESLLQDLQVVLDLFRELGIVVNPEKSNLVPSQVVQYLGMVLNTQSFVASPSPDRISRLVSTAGEFLSFASPPAGVWLSLLGMLSSMAHLVPGGRLCMRSLQHCLHRSWDRVDQSTPVAWSPDCLRDLRWWLHLPRLSQGVSLRQGAACRSSGSPPLPVVYFGQDSGSVLRQRHCRGVSSQRGVHQVSVSQLYRSGDPALVGVSPHQSGSTIHPGLPQRIGGHSLSSSSAPEYRVVPQHGGLSIFASSVADTDRFICHLGESLLFDLFFSDPRPSVLGHGCLSPILGGSSGVCLSSVVHHSPGPCQAPGVSGGRSLRG